jgi:short-subunit dehydrogenase
MAMAQKGATLSILARRRAELLSLAPRLMKAGAPQVHVIATDLDQSSYFERHIQEHLAQHGPIHIVLHNTGGPQNSERGVRFIST